MRKYRNSLLLPLALYAPAVPGQVYIYPTTGKYLGGDATSAVADCQAQGDASPISSLNFTGDYNILLMRGGSSAIGHLFPSAFPNIYDVDGNLLGSSPADLIEQISGQNLNFASGFGSGLGIYEKVWTGMNRDGTSSVARCFTPPPSPQSATEWSFSEDDSNYPATWTFSHSGGVGRLFDGTDGVGYLPEYCSEEFRVLCLKYPVTAAPTASPTAAPTPADTYLPPACSGACSTSSSNLPFKAEQDFSDQSTFRLLSIYSELDFSGNAGWIASFEFRHLHSFEAASARMRVTMSYGIANAAPSATLLDNIDLASRQVVFNGVADFAAGSAENWGLLVQLTSPFYYDPSVGPLVIDIQAESSSIVEIAYSSGVSSVASAPHDAKSGQVSSSGPIVRVAYTTEEDGTSKLQATSQAQLGAKTGKIYDNETGARTNYLASFSLVAFVALLGLALVPFVAAVDRLLSNKRLVYEDAAAESPGNRRCCVYLKEGFKNQHIFISLVTAGPRCNSSRIERLLICISIVLGHAAVSAGVFGFREKTTIASAVVVCAVFVLPMRILFGCVFERSKRGNRSFETVRSNDLPREDGRESDFTGVNVETVARASQDPLPGHVSNATSMELSPLPPTSELPKKKKRKKKKDKKEVSLPPISPASAPPPPPDAPPPSLPPSAAALAAESPESPRRKTTVPHRVALPRLCRPLGYCMVLAWTGFMVYGILYFGTDAKERAGEEISSAEKWMMVCAISLLAQIFVVEPLLVVVYCILQTCFGWNFVDKTGAAVCSRRRPL